LHELEDLLWSDIPTSSARVFDDIFHHNCNRDRLHVASSSRSRCCRCGHQYVSCLLAAQTFHFELAHNSVNSVLFSANGATNTNHVLIASRPKWQFTSRHTGALDVARWLGNPDTSFVLQKPQHFNDFLVHRLRLPPPRVSVRGHVSVSFVRFRALDGVRSVPWLA